MIHQQVKRSIGAGRPPLSIASAANVTFENDWILLPIAPSQPLGGKTVSLQAMRVAGIEVLLEATMKLKLLAIALFFAAIPKPASAVGGQYTERVECQIVVDTRDVLTGPCQHHLTHYEDVFTTLPESAPTIEVHVSRRVPSGRARTAWMQVLLEDGTWARKELLRVTLQPDKCFGNNFVRIAEEDQPAP